jgi:CheY-like chemotaxis protein
MTRVLIVDDEYGLLDALAMVLSEEGYEVATALNGREGLARVHEVRPDIILLDYMMPIVNGPEMLRQLRDDPATTNIPVIMMSAVATAAVRQQCRADAFLRKPFELLTALDAIARLVDGKT